MAVTFTQLPGALDLVFVAGDEVSVAITLGINLTGHTLSAGVYLSDTSVFSGGSSSSSVTAYSRSGADVITVTPTVVTASTGVITLGLGETQTASLTTGGRYRWYLQDVAPGGITRTLLSGQVIATAP